jgi:gluconolactonase
LTESNGTIWTADARGGVVKLNHEGLQKIITPYSNADLTTFEKLSNLESRYIQSKGSLPNGLCFDKNGNFIIANWGTNHIEKNDP